MKIAITGAHRVGKTTLAEKLQEHLVDHEICMEPYYEMEGLGYVFSEIPDVEDFAEQLEYAINQIQTSGDQVIFDRCPIDILAYIQALDEREDIQSIYHQVQSIITEIDLLVFVPIEEPDLITCRESDLPELRYRVNELLHQWIWGFGIEVLEVKGTLLNRRDQILGKISQEFKKNNGL